MNYNENSSLEEKIKYICNCEYNFFLNKSHVVGIGLGYKVTRGFITYEKCLKVFVDKKISSNNLLCKDLIPKTYKGIKTDITESGFSTSMELTSRIRPVVGGYSISNTKNPSAGTMGCLVTDGFSRFILGNNHVLANRNTLPLNSPIVQPAIDDKGKTSQDVIALLSKFIPIKFAGLFKKEVNYADCAIARLVDKSFATSDIAKLGKPKGIKYPVLDQTVAKCGRTTEVTLGKVTSINTTYTIGYGFKSALFKNQIITTYMCEPGDSGAVLLDNKKFIIGLLAGGSQICAVYNNIHDVLNLLSIQIVTD